MKLHTIYIHCINTYSTYTHTFPYIGLVILLTIESNTITYSIFPQFSRLFNIYPLSFLANLMRRRIIPLHMQSVMWFAGLRGAISFALVQQTHTYIRTYVHISSIHTFIHAYSSFCYHAYTCTYRTAEHRLNTYELIRTFYFIQCTALKCTFIHGA